MWLRMMGVLCLASCTFQKSLVAPHAAAAAATAAAASACGGEGRARYVAASDDPYTAAAVQEYKEAQGVHEIKADADVPAKG